MVSRIFLYCPSPLSFGAESLNKTYKLSLSLFSLASCLYFLRLELQNIDIPTWHACGLQESQLQSSCLGSKCFSHPAISWDVTFCDFKQAHSIHYVSPIRVTNTLSFIEICPLPSGYTQRGLIILPLQWPAFSTVTFQKSRTTQCCQTARSLWYLRYLWLLKLDNSFHFYIKMLYIAISS